MKVTDKDFQVMEDAIKPLDTDYWRERYRNRDIPRAESVKDIDKRYRWDLYYAAARVHGGLPDSTSGYNMSHIDTALKKIVKPLG